MTWGETDYSMSICEGSTRVLTRTCTITEQKYTRILPLSRGSFLQWRNRGMTFARMLRIDSRMNTRIDFR